MPNGEVKAVWYIYDSLDNGLHIDAQNSQNRHISNASAEQNCKRAPASTMFCNDTKHTKHRSVRAVIAFMHSLVIHTEWIFYFRSVKVKTMGSFIHEVGNCGRISRWRMSTEFSANFNTNSHISLHISFYLLKKRLYSERFTENTTLFLCSIWNVNVFHAIVWPNPTAPKHVQAFRQFLSFIIQLNEYIHGFVVYDNKELAEIKAIPMQLWEYTSSVMTSVNIYCPSVD